MFWLLMTSWLALAIIVGFGAQKRGWDGINWFTFAALCSPIIPALLVFARPRKVSFRGAKKAWMTREQSRSRVPVFEFMPDGVYAGIEYMVTQENAIVAAIASELVRFRTMDEFLAATAKKRAA